MMNIIWSKKIDEILSEGNTLESLGVNNWALSRKDAIYALTQLKKMGVGVLGGDVYLMKDDNFKPNYDNWFCEKTDLEIDSIFVERSISIAIDF